MKKLVIIPYSDSNKYFRIDDKKLSFIFKPKLPNPFSSAGEEKLIKHALRNPLGTKNIFQIVRQKDNIVILVDDFTRPTPAFRIIPFVLEELALTGIPDENISFVIARGTHRKMSESEIKEKVGENIVDRFRVINHEENADLVKIGISSRGTPIWINRIVAETDIRIAIGSICAHPIAGYGGGAKIIIPGVSGSETIHANHSLCKNPNVDIGLINKNPVRQDMNEISRIVNLDFIINVILNPQKEIIHVVTGDVIQAHQEGVKKYNRIYGFNITKKADIIVVGSSPRDATFGHAIFALYAAVPSVKKMGTIILVAPCTEGSGSSEYRQRFRKLASIKPEELMDLIRRHEVDASNGAFDYCYLKALKKCKIVLVSDNFSQSEANEIGVGYAHSLQTAVDNSLSHQNRNIKIGIVPVGGLTVPIYD